MTTVVIAVVGAIVVIGIGGNSWLLAQESHGKGRAKPWNTLVLRWIAFVSTLIILATFVVARPWYWDLAIGLVVVVALFGVSRSLEVLWGRPSTGSRRSIALSATSVFLGSLLLALAGIAGVLDGAALSAGTPLLHYHGGGVLRQPVLYQLFWGPEWHRTDPPPALTQAVAFGDELSGSPWAKEVIDSGFGVTSIDSAGCWIDPTPPTTSGVPASSISSGVFPTEVRNALTGRHRLLPCPHSHSPAAPPPLAQDALVALWLPVDIPYDLGGVADHGTLAWPGRPNGLAATGLPGSYAYWGLPGCSAIPSCQTLSSYAAPAYALSHEVVETITNPSGDGWFANGPLRWTARYVLEHGPPSLFGTAPPYPGEVADLCEPGGPSSQRRVIDGRLGPHGPPVAAFYRPSAGCTR